MGLVELVSWRKQRSSDPVFISLHSVLRNMQRPKDLARYGSSCLSWNKTNSGQMAKRMQFSVVGLPHYTIWHLYEPSVDDIRHMEVCLVIFSFVYLLTVLAGNGSRTCGSRERREGTC